MQGHRWKSSWPISVHRLADAAREEVIDEEMDLRDPASPHRRAIVHGDDRLDAELHGASRPEHARVYRSDGRTAAAVERLFERDLDQRDHAIERFGEAHVLHEGLQ